MAVVDQLYSEFNQLIDNSYFDIYTSNVYFYRVSKKQDNYTLSYNEEIEVIYEFQDLLKNMEIRENTRMICSHNYLDHLDFFASLKESSRQMKKNKLNYISVYTKERGCNSIHISKTDIGFVVTSEFGDINAEIETINDLIGLVSGVPRIVNTILYY